MSDLLTHWAVMDDARRLMTYVTGVDAAFARTLNTHHRVARLGAIARTEGHWVPRALKWVRAHWGTGPSEMTERKLACCVAALTHTACDALMKELRFQTVTAEEGREHSDEDVARQVYAYHDAHVFREVYRGGKEEPFSPFMFADNDTASGRRLEKLAKVLFQAAILGTRTFDIASESLDRPFLEQFIGRTIVKVRRTPDAVRRVVGSHGLCRRELYDWLRSLRSERDDADPKTWEEIAPRLVVDLTDPQSRLENILINELPLYVDHRRLVEAYNRPDPDRVRRYRIEPDFYDPADPAIAAARRIQAGEEVRGADVDAATSRGANRSFYGRALELAMEYERRGSAFWRGETETLETPNWSSDSDKALNFRLRHASEAELAANRTF